MKFRKKPVVVEAVQFDGNTFPDGVDRVYYSPIGQRTILTKADTVKCIVGVDYFAEIMTLEGPLRVSVGDWIIKGVAGEYYPCKPDIFEATYEPVTD